MDPSTYAGAIRLFRGESAPPGFVKVPGSPYAVEYGSHGWYEMLRDRGDPQANDYFASLEPEPEPEPPVPQEPPSPSPWVQPPADPVIPPGQQLPGLTPNPPTGIAGLVPQSGGTIPATQPVPVPQVTGTSPVALGGAPSSPPVPDISVPQTPPRPFGLQDIPSWYLDPLPMQSYLTYGFGPEHTFFKPERAVPPGLDVETTTPESQGLGGGIAAIDPSLYTLYDQNMRKWYGGYS